MVHYISILLKKIYEQILKLNGTWSNNIACFKCTCKCVMNLIKLKWFWKLSIWTRKFKGMHIGIVIEGFMVMFDFKNHHESCSWSGICKYMYLVIISRDWIKGLFICLAICWHGTCVYVHLPLDIHLGSG